MLNSVQLMGRLTADPVRSVTQTGKEVCRFQIAVDKTVNGERKADFITIVTWEGTAVHVEKYFRKGSMIAVDGSIRSDTYEDKKGYKRTDFSVVAREVHFCGSKNEGKAKAKESSPSVSRTDSSLKEGASEVVCGYYSNATAADFEEIGCDDDDYEVSV